VNAELQTDHHADKLAQIETRYEMTNEPLPELCPSFSIRQAAKQHRSSGEIVAKYRLKTLNDELTGARELAELWVTTRCAMARVEVNRCRPSSIKPKPI
jgi:hypothetical protein